MNETVQRNKDLVARYKHDIDLVAFLEQDGYALVRHKSTRRWPVLKHPVTAEKLIVGRSEKTGDYFYLNPEDSRDRGSIIDYTADRLRLDLNSTDGWRSLHEHLSGYMGRPLLRPEPAPTTGVELPGSGSAEPKFFKLDPFEQPGYLRDERKLLSATYGHPAFIGKIFNKTLRDPATDQPVVNTCFPLENDRARIGIIVRNTAFNKIFGEKAGGLWRSALPFDHRPSVLFVAESPIDCLSYHQLYPPKQPFDRLYVATAGTPAHGQFTALQQLIDRYQPEMVVLGNDNEPGGIRYNVNWLGRLTLPQQPDSGLTATIANHGMNNTLTVTVADPGRADAIAKQVGTTLNRGFPADNWPVAVEVRPGVEGASLIRATFSTDRQLLIRAEGLVSTLRGLTDYVRVQRPAEKDWNEDVKAKAGQQQVRKETVKPARQGRKPKLG